MLFFSFLHYVEKKPVQKQAPAVEREVPGGENISNLLLQMIALQKETLNLQKETLLELRKGSFQVFSVFILF